MLVITLFSTLAKSFSYFFSFSLEIFFLDNPINDGGQWDMFLNIIKKYGIVPKSAMPETYNSSNTLEINKILKRILRMYAYELREDYKNNKSLEEIENKKLEMIEKIYNILCTAFGAFIILI